MKCVNDCPSSAIDIEKGTIDDTCIHCGHCVAICPESTIFPDTGDIKELESSTISSSDFQHLSSNLRTCRSYLSKAVEEETMEMLIENMKHYPSASNSRPLELTVVKSKDIIQKLNDQTANGLINSIKLVTSPIVKPLVKIFAPKIDVEKLDRYKTKFVENQSPESSQVCHHAPSVMLFHAPITKYGMASADAYIWATYTSLFAQALGLGTCFNGFIVMSMKRSKAMRTEFSIPDNHMVYSALLIGYPKVKYKNEVGREKPKVNFI